MILNDCAIGFYANQHDMIAPFINSSVKEDETGKVISYGLSSFGYDIRMGTEVRFLIPSTRLIDPKAKSNSRNFNQDYEAFTGIIPPNSGILTVSVEYFKMPVDVMAIAIGKSTYARCGLIVNITPLEPGWEGYLTIELINTNPYPIKVYPGEGIAQLIFFKGRRPALSYASRSGKYQGQIGVVDAKV